MAFGDVGGTTFPTRTSAPSSKVVDYYMSPNAWATDWQNRYNQEAATPVVQSQHPLQLNPGGEGYDPTNWSKLGLPFDPYIVDDKAGTYQINPQGYNNLADSMTDPSSKQAILDYVSKNFGKSMQITPGASQMSGEYVKASGPDFTALNSERDRMTPIMENAQRAQQGYDSMTGWGQQNGIRSANYSDPNFGQINGYFGQDKLGANPTEGLDMGWAGGTALGKSPLSNSNSTVWGAAPTRRQWGL